MTSFFVDKITLLTIAIPMIALLFVGYVSYENTIQLIKMGSFVNKINLIIQKLEQLFSTITDAETGQRGFIITDRSDYLEPYNSAIKDIHNRLLNLNKLVANEPTNPNQQQQLSSLNELDILKNLIKDKLNELNQTISLRQSHGINAALSIILSNKGKSLMDKIRATTLVIQRQQNTTLSNVTRQSQEYVQGIIHAIIITTLTAASITGVMLFAISRSIHKHYLKSEILLQTKVKDRTEELQIANNHLLVANEQLKIHDRMQKEFINVAAHELRTPIQPILGLTETLLEEIKDSHQIEMLDIVLRNAQRLSKLTEDILDVTKIESNSLKLNKEQINLYKLISNIITDYNKTRFKKGNNLDTRLLLLEFDHSKGKDDAFLVHADKARINQVIINLLDNAIKFTKENGTITIRIETIEDGRYILVTVKDNGMGIDSEIISKLFSKFVTKSFQGTGLGLFITKSIVEAHAGRIWAKNNNSNTEGEGATFAFTLPLHNQLSQQSK